MHKLNANNEIQHCTYQPQILDSKIDDQDLLPWLESDYPNFFFIITYKTKKLLNPEIGSVKSNGLDFGE